MSFSLVPQHRKLRSIATAATVPGKRGRERPGSRSGASALPLARAVRAGLSARDAGDGVRRPRSGVRLLQDAGRRGLYDNMKTAVDSVLASFQALRELTRKVEADCAIEVDGNAYSVPWRLIGEQVRVMVTAEALRVVHAGREVAVHAREAGRRRRVVDAAHFEGVAGSRGRVIQLPAPEAQPALLRPLAEYEALVGGGF